jgi:hypothetical protein
MSKGTVFVGMDMHAETIAVAVAEGRDQVRSLGTSDVNEHLARKICRDLEVPAP